MIKNIIRYLGLALVIIGIVLVMKNLFSTDNNEWNTKNLKNNSSAKNYYEATIKLLDEETKDYIVGTNLVLKNDKKEIIDEWTTINTKHTVIKLEKGTYILEQTSITDGYKDDKKTITFKITNDNKNIVMYNKKEGLKQVEEEVNVDNTLSKKSYLTILVAISTLLAGIKLVLFPNKQIIKER